MNTSLIGAAVCLGSWNAACVQSWRRCPATSTNGPWSLPQRMPSKQCPPALRDQSPESPGPHRWRPERIGLTAHPAASIAKPRPPRQLLVSQPFASSSPLFQTWFQTGVGPNNFFYYHDSHDTMSGLLQTWFQTGLDPHTIFTVMTVMTNNS